MVSEAVVAHRALLHIVGRSSYDRRPHPAIERGPFQQPGLATVVAADVDAEGLQRTVDEIRAAGGTASAVPFDAAEAGSCVALVEEAARVGGRLDIVVNVAGVSGFRHLHETTTESFERTIAINLTSVMILCREAMPHLKATKGCIVNFASINARVPTAYQAAYAASKAGVLALTKCLAQEFSSDGVRCNAICPGGFDTPMNENVHIPEGADMKLVAKNFNPKIPFAPPEQITGVVSFLASEDAAFVTGEQIVVDGGVTSII